MQERKQEVSNTDSVEKHGGKSLCGSSSLKMPKAIMHIYVQCTYSRPSLARSPMDSLNYFEIAMSQHIRFAELRKKISRTITHQN